MHANISWTSDPTHGFTTETSLTVFWGCETGLIFEISGVLLFLASFVMPIGIPMLVTLLVFWLGPWVISLAFAYSKAPSDEPLLG